MTDAYTVDYANYRSQMMRVSAYFTIPGWIAFKDTMVSTGSLQAIMDQRLVVSALPDGPVLTRGRAAVDGRLTYMVEFPMVMTYQTQSEISREHNLVRADVVRVSDVDHPGGVAIDGSPPSLRPSTKFELLVT